MSVFASNVIRWQIGHFGEGDFGRPITEGAKARRALRGRLDPPVRTRLRSQERFSAIRTENEALEWAARMMPKVQVGQVLLFKEEETGTIWALRKIRDRLKLPIKDTIGNRDIDRIVTYVVANHRCGSAGICNRRKIGGSSDWSQHSPWKPPDPGANAWDYTGSFRTLKRITDDLVRHADELHVGRIIFNRRIWEPGSGWRPYGGEDPHTTHGHVEGRPERHGTPKKSC